eukprot:1203281-Heterocapsa_arctica.AAC.1
MWNGCCRCARVYAGVELPSAGSRSSVDRPVEGLASPRLLLRAARAGGATSMMAPRGAAPSSVERWME